MIKPETWEIKRYRQHEQAAAPSAGEDPHNVTISIESCVAALNLGMRHRIFLY